MRHVQRRPRLWRLQRRPRQTATATAAAPAAEAVRPNACQRERRRCGRRSCRSDEPAAAPGCDSTVPRRPLRWLLRRRSCPVSMWCGLRRMAARRWRAGGAGGGGVACGWTGSRWRGHGGRAGQFRGPVHAGRQCRAAADVGGRGQRGWGGSGGDETLARWRRPLRCATEVAADSAPAACGADVATAAEAAPAAPAVAVAAAAPAAILVSPEGVKVVQPATRGAGRGGGECGDRQHQLCT